MRLVCYLGTRGCPGVLEDALRDYFDPLVVLVPVEPRLLGPELVDQDLAGGLTAVAEILRERAYARAVAMAEASEGQLTGVFDQQPDVEDRITARVLEPPIEEALAEAARDTDADECYLARDALDVLDDVSIRPADALEPEGVELVTR